METNPGGPESFTMGKKVITGGDLLGRPLILRLGGLTCLGFPGLGQHHSQGRGDPMPAPPVSNQLGFLGLWAKRLERSPHPRLGEGVSCQVTEDPDAPRPR